MKDLKKQIEDRAYNNYDRYDEEGWYKWENRRTNFIDGALSPEAKEYWQEGMYTLQQVSDIFESDFIDDYLNYILDNNKCTNKNSINYYSFKDWFEQNKKQ